MGDPALTKRICGFDSRLLLGPVIPKTFKNGSGLFLHGTHDEGGTCCLTLSPCAPNKVIKGQMCDVLSIYGTLHIKDPMPLFQKCRIVVQAVGILSSHEYSHQRAKMPYSEAL